MLVVVCKESSVFRDTQRLDTSELTVAQARLHACQWDARSIDLFCSYDQGLSGLCVWVTEGEVVFVCTLCDCFSFVIRFGDEAKDSF